MPVPSQVRHQFCLAFKEVLHNIVKHARAGEVRIKMDLTGPTLGLEIVDDGVGFDPAARPVPDGIHDGLQNLGLRMREISGTSSVDSAPGAGTRVRLEVKIPPFP